MIWKCGQKKKQRQNPLIMFPVFSALENVSTEEREGGAGLVVSAGDALHLQLKVQLRRFGSRQIGQRRLSPERSGLEVVGLCALIL